MEEKLSALSPEEVLRRGFSITTRSADGRIIDDASLLEPSEAIRIRFHQGAAKGIVKEIEKV